LVLSSNEHETAAQSGATFSASFEAISAATQYRSPRETPKPLIQGLQTAKVVGPPGEEIYTDEYGRVKVHFHWDRYGQENENDSCWIRVSHPWAGKNYGGIHIPRIGQEVVVEFMEGDPDRPLITGRVYNAQQMPPWKLPDHKTQSGTLSNWSIGGGGASMLRFEDKKGIEHLELSNTYGQTHLHMGYLMNQGSGAQRGYGFELRTNLWGSIRADKGLLISTYTQDFTSKVANDNPDGLEHMGAALSNTSSLMEEASQAVSTAKDMIGALCSGKASQISGMVSSLASMFKGGGGAMAAAGACWESLAGGGPGGDGGGETGMPANADPAMPDAQRMMNLSKDIGQPIVSIVSPEGQTMISPKPVVISSGQSTSVHAQQHVTISSGAQLTQLSRSGMFTHVTSGGQVNVVSAGDVATTAKTGAMNLVAKKDATIASTTANANVIAKQKIVMNAQSSDILANAAQGVAATAGHTIALVAGDSISLVCGQASITLRKDGTIELIGRDIKLKGTGEGRVEFDGELIQNGSKINLNC
ncbi:MAG TPA: type VI secretion system tip protein TssI/VgrG, partial [Rhodocyclaceae bacterium]|nr:type VI secretion system tip protein TssI/VgrG [Rhodocyclaceae bacterium]